MIACCDAPPTLQASEHDLNPVAPFVAALVALHGLLAGLPAGDANLYPFVFQSVSEPVGVISPVAQKPSRLRQTAQQSRRAGLIAHLTGRHEEPDRRPLGIRDSA